MTNGEYITRIVEQNEDFCVLTNDVDGTVTIEVSLDWWNEPNTSTVDKIREDISDEIKNRYTEVRDKSMIQWCRGKVSGLKRALEIIDKYKTKPKDIGVQATELLAEARVMAESENEQSSHFEGNLVDGVPSEKSERYNNF